MKSISTINPASTEKQNIQSFICTPVIDLKVGVSLDQSVSLCFVLLPAHQTIWETFQAKNNVRSA